MNISKFSRSIVVVIFVAFIISSCVLDFSLLISGSKSPYSGILKLGYAVIIFAFVILYMYLKDKLYKIKMCRKISLVYRYIYLFIVCIASIFITKKNILETLSTLEIIIVMIDCILISFVVKRIIFNVSKSDMLSVFGMCMSSLMMNVLNDKLLFFKALAIASTMVLSILVLQILIDELKQKGMRTPKYIFQAFCLGILIGINIVFGINYMIWIIIAISMLFVTMDLDNTHINFPKKFMASLTQEKRESLYKIERININKLFVSIFIVLLVSVLVVNVSNVIINKYSANIGNEFVQYLTLKIDKSNGNLVIITMENLRMFLSMSRTYYIVISMYILILEILAFLLNRKYDTKSTIIKLLFLVIFIYISYFNLNVLVYQPTLTVLLIIIAIVNTSNLYLNREERIKLLVA